MNGLLNEFERKQLQTMEQIIDQFFQGKIDLFKLSPGLSYLVNSLESFENFELKELRGQINGLEYLCECIEDGSVKSFNENPEFLISNYLVESKKIIQRILNLYLSSVDPLVSKRADIINEDWLFCPNCLDAWESNSKNAMVICPKCDEALHNPRYKGKTK